VHRRLFLLSAAAAALPAAVAAREGGRGGATVRFGLTPVFLDDHVGFLQLWRRYLESRLERPVLFVQRGSYREISDLLRKQELDFAWICGYPFVRYRRELRLLAVPLYRGKPLYRSYIIVPASDPFSESIVDLRGKIFAYSDPNSNSGYLYANYRLAQLKEDRASFFKKAFFTWGHRKVVEAVAAGLANGGAVDGYVWETLNRDSRELTRRTRVLEKSPEFGFPPVVARGSVPRADFEAVQEVLLTMAADPDGRSILGRLDLDGFAAGSEQLFDGIRHMIPVVDPAPHAPAA
jgi:phosphonate transport system substrate-binding protein